MSVRGYCRVFTVAAIGIAAIGVSAQTAADRKEAVKVPCPHRLGNLDINQPPPNNLGVPLDTLRPFRGFSVIQAFASIFNSNYNSLQASLVHRLKHGISFQASYTYSKALADSPGPNFYPSFPQDSHNIHGEYGPVFFDLTHNFSLNYSWDLPFFKRTHGIAKEALDGWQISGITSFQSGQPLTVVFNGTDQAGVGAYGWERPDQIANPFVAGPVPSNPDPLCSKTISQGGRAADRVHTRDAWFNPCAFAAQTPGTFGNAHHGSLRGPRGQNWDLSLMKNFVLHESTSLQFRAEAFNVFNHPNPGTPNLGIDDPEFARITSSYSPRILQMSLALKF